MLNSKLLSQVEYKKRFNFRCIHGHNGLPVITEHPQCYNRTHNLIEKIGFFDIEIYGNNFNAPFGIVLTYCIKELNGKIYKGSGM